MRARRNTTDEVEHTHSFTRLTADFGIHYCLCGAGLISEEEFGRRCDLWDLYYAEVKNTKADRLAKAMAAAILAKDRARIKRLVAYSKTRVVHHKSSFESQDYWERLVPLELALPDYPDPQQKYLFFQTPNGYIPAYRVDEPISEPFENPLAQSESLPNIKELSDEWKEVLSP